MKRVIIFMATVVYGSTLLAQVGIGTTSPAPSAILDISANNKGVLIPKVFLTNITSTMLDGTNIAAVGLLIYNTNVGTIGGSGVGYYYFNGTIWERLITSQNSFDDGDWVANGGDIERQSGNVFIGNTHATNNDLYISNQIIDWDNSSYYLDPASNNCVNEIQFDDGSAADPSLYFEGDATTGFFSPATNEIAYSINSSEVLRIDASGNLGVGTPSPSASLDVEGTFKLGTDGNSHSGMYSLHWNFGTTSIPANSSVVLTITGTNSVLNIPQQTGVSVAFESDIGASVLVQHVWMDTDAINIRLSNTSASLVSFLTLANILFVWQ
ncbi:MAG: hypothetical protein R2781_07825 [Flavobacteriaceae bacterium]